MLSLEFRIANSNANWWNYEAGTYGPAHTLRNAKYTSEDKTIFSGQFNVEEI